MSQVHYLPLSRFYITMQAFLLVVWIHAEFGYTAVVLQPDSIRTGLDWEFNRDGDAEGWQANPGGSSLQTSNGRLTARLIKLGYLSSTEFDLAAADFGFIYIRMRTPGATSVKIKWINEYNLTGQTTFSVINDSSFHEYEIAVHTVDAWVNRIKRISQLTSNAAGKGNAVLEIDYIRVLSIGSRISIRTLKTYRTMLQVGRAFPITSVIQNTGDQKSGLYSVRLLLPESVDLLNGNPHAFKEFSVGEDTCQWMVTAKTPGLFHVQLLLTDADNDSLIATVQLAISQQTWQLDRIFISTWGIPADNDPDYEYYAKANFTALLGVWSESQIARAAKFGMQCLVDISGAIDVGTYLRAPYSVAPPEIPDEELAKLDGFLLRYQNNPTVIGYYITDEPNIPAFPNQEKVFSYIHAKDPERMAFINLFPTHAKGADDVAQYCHYIEQFMEITKPEFFSFCHYPFNVIRTETNWFCNLEIIRDYSLKYDVPFAQIIQGSDLIIYEWSVFLDTPSPQELRWQVYSTLVYGGKGILYFYWNNLLASPKRDELYSAIQQLNREILVLGPTLLKLRSCGVYHTRRIPYGCAKLTADGLVKAVTDSADMVVGVFKDETENDYLFIMNKDSSQDVTATVSLSEANSKLEALDIETGSWIPVSVSAANGESQFTYSFKPGGGALFALTASTGVSAAEKQRAPAYCYLAQNYPNPFNASTMFAYDLEEESAVRLTVYDILGREIAILVDKKQLPGKYQYTWQAEALPSGIYFYNLQVGVTAQSHKMLLLK